jgi:endonuclease/exonuclease/phosphatase family metal-dependent hydrolase
MMILILRGLSRVPDVVIGSMNLHAGIGTRGQPFDVEAAILSLNAPVVVLQETWSPDSAAGDDPVEAAAQALGAEVFRVPVRHIDTLRTVAIPADSGPGTVGIALLSALPVTGYEVLKLGNVPGDLVTRRAQIATIELPGGAALRVVGTHLTYRLLSPVQLARLLRYLSGSTLPTVIAGDLNMPRQLARLAPGFAAAVRGRTWPAELPMVQLDHVLTSRQVAHAHGTVLPPAGSDHLPVRARLQLAG